MGVWRRSAFACCAFCNASKQCWWLLHTWNPCRVAAVNSFYMLVLTHCNAPTSCVTQWPTGVVFCKSRVSERDWNTRDCNSSFDTLVCWWTRMLMTLEKPICPDCPEFTGRPRPSFLNCMNLLENVKENRNQLWKGTNRFLFSRERGRDNCWLLGANLPGKKTRSSVLTCKSKRLLLIASLPLS